MAGGGGAWKVAYADFVTAMMALFLVMWITSQNDKVKEAIAEHFSEPDSFFTPLESSEGSPSGTIHRGKKHPSKDDKNKSAKRKKNRGLPKPRAISLYDSDRPGVGCPPRYGRCRPDRPRLRHRPGVRRRPGRRC